MATVTASSAATRRHAQAQSAHLVRSTVQPPSRPPARAALSSTLFDTSHLGEAEPAQDPPGDVAQSDTDGDARDHVGRVVDADVGS